MRKHHYLTMLLLAGLPLVGAPAAYALPEPQQQGQAETVINGTVLDENDEPVIGASVVQKGNKTNAVATDAFGHFKIRVAAGAQLGVACGQCERACPQQLKVIERLRDCAAAFER